jgi:hypothetical protein
MCVSTAVETSHERMGPAAPTHALPRRAGLRVGVPPPPSPSVLIGHASSHPRTNRTRLSEANRRWRAGERVRNLQEGCLLQQDTRRSGPRRVQRDETCPISTEGGTRRVHFVREGGGSGPRPASCWAAWRRAWGWQAGGCERRPSPPSASPPARGACWVMHAAPPRLHLLHPPRSVDFLRDLLGHVLSDLLAECCADDARCLSVRECGPGVHRVGQEVVQKRAVRAEDLVQVLRRAPRVSAPRRAERRSSRGGRACKATPLGA